jgi:hypothetical protein
MASRYELPPDFMVGWYGSKSLLQQLWL